MKRYWTDYKGYILAVGIAAFIVIVRLWFLDGWLRRPSAFAFLIFAVLGAAWAGGLKPGIFATLVCTALGVGFFVDLDGWLISRRVDAIRTVIFMVTGSVVCGVFEFLHRAKRRYEAAAVDALHKQKLLEDADRRKDEFLATLAHELRNPLSPISNAIQLWPYVVNQPDEMEELRGVISRQVQHMTRIINDLLDVSRISRGRLQLRSEPVNMALVIQQSVETVGPLVKQYKHELAVDVSSEPLWVKGDADRLTQVLGNILNNAAKYTPSGGKIRLEARRKGNRVVVSTHDNGIGIPRGMEREVFEMFRQVDLTTSRSHEGLGIGLTLVQQIVENHGGTVVATSAGDGQGSAFVVSLPALELPPFASSTNGDIAASASHIPRLKVLVVDDASESAETLAQLLTCWGQEVTIASDGPAAITAVTSQHPDLVLLDIAMPGMDGYAVARSLRARPELDDIMLVALTGYGRDEDRRHAEAAGFDRHLTKPADTRQLEQLLQELSAKGRVTAAR